MKTHPWFVANEDRVLRVHFAWQWAAAQTTEVKIPNVSVTSDGMLAMEPDNVAYLNPIRSIGSTDKDLI